MTPHGMSKLDRMLAECLSGHGLTAAAPLPQVFGYLLRENPITGTLERATIARAFDDLVETLRSTTRQDGPAAAGMFFGQFIDHDITFEASSVIGTRIDPRSIRHIRTPNLDLDSAHGNGPEAIPHLYAPGTHGMMQMGHADNPDDLPRNSHGTAIRATMKISRSARCMAPLSSSTIS